METKDIGLTNVGKTEKWKESLKEGWPMARPVIQTLILGIKNPILKALLNSVVAMVDKLIE